MKKIWLDLREWNKSLVTEALESGVDAILTIGELVADIRDLGRIEVIAPDAGDLKVPDDVEIVVIKDKGDENRAAAALKSRMVAVRTTDWDIIPIENLIPQGGERLFLFVRNLAETETAVRILEKGVAGVVLETHDPAEVARVARFIKDLDRESFSLERLVVRRVATIGMGDRVCIDTCANMEPGQGMLVGNSSQCLFLVHAENLENPYVAPRPFRVNAGAVHSYVRVPGNKTRYLGELKTGDPVLVVNSRGETEVSFVGRSKIEKRPLLVLSAVDSRGVEYSAVLQNAETIRLVGTDGVAMSVVSLKEGDTVLGLVEGGGRHFGMAVDETIREQ
ncbi:MAG: 3-dehydroquinate synthase II [Spirochaetes bacterium]|nr:3-dehydroquinate synthase II [Spirochaetota bacterium]